MKDATEEIRSISVAETAELLSLSQSTIWDAVKARDLPSFKIAYLSILKHLHENGVAEINGHLLYQISDDAYAEAQNWLQQKGLVAAIDEEIAAYLNSGSSDVDKTVDTVTIKFPASCPSCTVSSRVTNSPSMPARTPNATEFELMESPREPFAGASGDASRLRAEPNTIKE